jgi:hypothetical protein
MKSWNSLRSWSQFEIFALAAALIAMVTSSGVLTIENLISTPGARTAVIGTVVFKIRVAETKHNDQSIWVSLPQNAPVYDRDTIRTDKEAIAEITLNQQTKISLGPDSMILLDTPQSMKVTRGTVKVKSVAAKPMTIESGKGSLELKNGEAVLSTDGNKTTTTLVEGVAAFSGGSATTELKAGSASAFDREGKKTEVPLAASSPIGGTLVYTVNDSEEVAFAWTAGEGRSVTLVVADNQELKNPLKSVVVKSLGAKVNLPKGNWWWAVKDETGISPVERFELKKLGQPTIITPEEASVPATEGHPQVDVRWSRVEGADSYRVELSGDVQTPTQTQVVSDTSASLDLKKVGQYSLKVVALFGALGLESASAPRGFSVIPNAPAPMKWTDEKGDPATLNLATLGGQTGTFSWWDDGQSRYRVQIFQDQGTRALRQTTVSGNSYRLDNDLPEGRYALHIVRLADDGSASSQVLDRTVVLTRPRPPVLISPVNGILTPITDHKVDFTVDDPNGSSRVRIDVATDEAMSSVASTSVTRDRKATLLLPEGRVNTLFWRATIVSTSGRDLAASSVEAFRIPSYLDVPVFTSPVPGSRIDLLKNDSVRISWASVAEANLYDVKLYRIMIGSPVLIRSWETSSTTLVWNEFANLSPDTFSIELTALKKDRDNTTLGQSPVVKNSFYLGQSAKVQAVKIDSKLVFEAD